MKRKPHLQLQLVFFQRGSKLVQGQEFAKGVEAHQLGQQLQGTLAHNGSLVLQPACIVITSSSEATASQD